MIELTHLRGRNTHLTFLDGSTEQVVVQEIVIDVNGHPLWLEGYSSNVIGQKPNPTAVYPWNSIRRLYPM